MLSDSSAPLLPDLHLPDSGRSLDRVIGRTLIKFSLDNENLVLGFYIIGTEDFSPDLLKIPLSQFPPDIFSDSLEAIVAVLNKVAERFSSSEIHKFGYVENLVRDGLRDQGIIMDSAEFDRDLFIIYSERFEVPGIGSVEVICGETDPNNSLEQISYYIEFDTSWDDDPDGFSLDRINVPIMDLPLIRNVIGAVVLDSADKGYDIFKVKNLIVAKFLEIGVAVMLES